MGAAPVFHYAFAALLILLNVAAANFAIKRVFDGSPRSPRRTGTLRTFVSGLLLVQGCAAVALLNQSYELVGVWLLTALAYLVVGVLLSWVIGGFTDHGRRG